MKDYAAIVEAKYPKAKHNLNFRVTYGPKFQPATFDENGKVLLPDNSKAEWVHEVTEWLLDGKPPTIEELEEWAASQEYLTVALALKKFNAIERINQTDATAAEKSGTITATISMSLRYTHNAMLVKQWQDQGKPEKPDEFIYAAAYAEAEKFIPPYTASQMLAVWEKAWTQMSNEPGRALRRWALEVVKAAKTIEDVEAVVSQYQKTLEQYLG